ncbi:MAG: sugar-binding domain-containing protein [Christensenellales bacterium]
MYKKTVKIPSDWNGKIILRFEAAFYETHVVVNGKYLGSHSGGYTPFAFDVTDCIADGEANIFVYCSRQP